MPISHNQQVTGSHTGAVAADLTLFILHCLLLKMYSSAWYLVSSWYTLTDLPLSKYFHLIRNGKPQKSGNSRRVVANA